jgi:hypothetical protein
MSDRSMAQELAETRSELARREKEILRLRALLVSRDRELGAARGRLKLLEAWARPLLGVGKRLRGGVWGLRRRAAAILGLFTRRR